MASSPSRKPDKPLQEKGAVISRDTSFTPPASATLSATLTSMSVSPAFSAMPITWFWIKTLPTSALSAVHDQVLTSA